MMKKAKLVKLAEKIKKAYLEGYQCGPGLVSAVACASENGVEVQDELYEGGNGYKILLSCKTVDNTEFVVDPEKVAF